jgi:hypothetical protein
LRPRKLSGHNLCRKPLSHGAIAPSLIRVFPCVGVSDFIGDVQQQREQTEATDLSNEKEP